MATDSPSPRATLPPPIPRKHPSRQSISHSNSASPASERSRRPFPDLSSSGGSVGSSSEYGSSSNNTGSGSGSGSGSASSARQSLQHENESSQLPTSKSGLIAPSPSRSATYSSSGGPLSTGSVSGGMAANVVGLGSTRVMDFKDWVTAGRESRGEPSPKQNGDSAHKSSEHHHQHITNPASASNTPPPRPTTASLDVNSKASSIPSSHSIAHSMSSISIDSSRSPQTDSMRSPLELSSDHRGTPPLDSGMSTARRLSYELGRHVNGSTTSNGTPRRFTSLSPTHESDSRYSSPRENPNSPLERRFSRRLAMPMRRETSNGPVETVNEEEETLEGHSESHRSPRKSYGGAGSRSTTEDPGPSLDERIRQAEEKLSRRQSANSNRLSSALVATPPSGRVTPLRRLGHGSRASLSSRASMSPTLVAGGRSNGHAAYDSREADAEPEYERGRDNSSSGGSRNLSKPRPSLPSDFQNGSRMLTPSPNPGDGPTLRRPLRFSMIDTQQQPGGRHPYDLESPSAQSFATARPASGLEHRDSPWLRDRWEAREELLQDFESPRRNREQTHGRAGSVLETASDRYRYGLSGSQSHHRLSHIASSNDIGSHGTHATPASRRISALLDRNRDYSSHRDLASIAGDTPTISRHSRDLRDLREFSSSRALGPSDSVSAIGSRELEPGRKDPLEVLRRLEETRSQHNRRWEEDRAASVLGDHRDRDRDRSATALGDSGSGAGGIYRSASVIGDGSGGGYRYRASSRLDDLGGRTSSRLDDLSGRASSRLSGTYRVTPRSATSAGSYYDTPRTAPALRRFPVDDPLDSPLHGRGGAASVLHPSSEPRPRRSQTSFGSRVSGASFSSGGETDHGRNLMDAARVLAKAEGSISAATIAKLSAVADTMERANTGVRAAAAIAGELALDLDDSNATVRDRLPRLQITLREAGRASDQAVRDLTEALLGLRGGSSGTGVSTPVQTPAREDGHRRVSASTNSPARPPRSESISSLASAQRGSRSGLEAIEQSPPKPPSKRTSSMDLRASLDQLPSPAATDPESKLYGDGKEVLSSSRSPPSGLGFPESFSERLERDERNERGERGERVLRKQASTISTHTVRQRPLSFVPAHAPEPTTAVSTAMASPNDKDRAPARPARRDSTLSTTSISEERGADLQRKGTFGAMDAARVKRESVSERFRKHLSGE